MTTTFTTSLYQLFRSLASTTSDLTNAGQVLHTKAVPGLMTVLDTALQQSVEMELTGTLTTSHALLAALLGVKRQAKIVLMEWIRNHEAAHSQSSSHALSTTSATVSSSHSNHKLVVESLARACLDAANDMLQVLAIEKLAETANLTDPYQNKINNNHSPHSSHHHHHQQHHHQPNDHSDNPMSTITSVHSSGTDDTTPTTALLEATLEGIDQNNNNNSHHHATLANTKSSSGAGSALSHLSAPHSTLVDATTTTRNFSEKGVGDGWWKALYDSTRDTGRWIPLAQRRRDLWETSRLHCVDYMWSEEVSQTSQRLLRHLVKHPLVSEVNHHHHQNKNQQITTGQESWWWGQPGGNLAPSPTLASFSMEGREEIMILLTLIQVDLPVRVLQFRAACEAESVVLKRLYLLKCELRAPFRAFLEAHQSILRAPSISFVEEYQTAMALNKHYQEEQKQKAKKKLRALLETPALVECLTLEQTCQHLEIEMSKSLYPFCELARYLDHKRAIIRQVDPVMTVKLQTLLHRLKGLLTRKAAGHDSSVGIRPLLLDLQNIPREDELSSHSSRLGSTRTVTVHEWEDQVESLIMQLVQLNECCRTRGSFGSDKKADVEAPAVIAERCACLDVELFRCHCVDWFTLVQQQHQSNQDWAALAEEIHQAELELSLAAVGTTEALGTIAQRLRLFEEDRTKRFPVLEQVLDDFGRRELNMVICLQPPEPRQVLELRPSSAKGVFGHALEMHGETLPLG